MKTLRHKQSLRLTERPPLPRHRPFPVRMTVVLIGVAIMLIVAAVTVVTSVIVERMS